MKRLVVLEEEIKKYALNNPDEEIKLPYDLLLKAKKEGFSDRQLSNILNAREGKMREYRKEQNITPAYKLVDTCGGEFEAKQPYYYSTY